MPTAACGINCDVCKLRLMEICSSCGPGTSRQAIKKIDAQKRMFGHPCPILACAQLNRVQYCMRDCQNFPCEVFASGPYPFSESYLNMQKRRRKQHPPERTPRGDLIEVPYEYWEQLRNLNMPKLCNRCLVVPHPPEGVLIRHLNDDLLIDMNNACLWRLEPGEREKIDHPLLQLVVLVYLLNATVAVMSNEMIGVNDLKDAHFFQGPHVLKITPLVERYGNDLESFKEAAKHLGGKPLSLADTAYKFSPLPKVPLYYLLWEGDEEFQPRLSILFDRSIENHLSADAIWGLVNLVSGRLLKGA